MQINHLCVLRKLKAMYITTLMYIEICNVKGYDIFFIQFLLGFHSTSSFHCLLFREKQFKTLSKFLLSFIRNDAIVVSTCDIKGGNILFFCTFIPQNIIGRLCMINSTLLNDRNISGPKYKFYNAISSFHRES